MTLQITLIIIIIIVYCPTGSCPITGQFEVYKIKYYKLTNLEAKHRAIKTIRKNTMETTNAKKYSYI